MLDFAVKSYSSMKNNLEHSACLGCMLLPEARVGGHGYSSTLVCLTVCL